MPLFAGKPKQALAEVGGGVSVAMRTLPLSPPPSPSTPPRHYFRSSLQDARGPKFDPAIGPPTVYLLSFLAHSNMKLRHP